MFKWHLHYQLKQWPCMVCLLFALWIQVLVIYGFHSLPFFLVVITIMLHQSVGLPTDTGIMISPFHVFPKGLPYWFFEVEKHSNWFMSSFRDCTIFKVDVGCKTRHRREYSIILKCWFGKMLQEPILEPTNVLFSWGERRDFGAP